MGGRGASSGRRSGAERALASLEQLELFDPQNSSDLVRTPLRRDGDFWGADFDPANIRSGGRYETVDPRQLRSPQGYVSRRLVREYLTGAVERSSSDVPLVAMNGDEMWLFDGNHRAAAALLSGQRQMLVRVI